MMKKIIGLIICMMFIAISGFSVVGYNENENRTNIDFVKYSSEHDISNFDSFADDNFWIKIDYNTEGGTLKGRENSCMVYDSVNDCFIVFGGSSSSGPLNDTWEYNFTTNTWLNRTALPTYGEIGGNLEPRSCHDMVYDSKAERVIMFGGTVPGPSFSDETWVYNYSDNKWYNMTPSMAVSGGTLYGRIDLKMAYDSSADRTIMFGGVTGGTTPLNDTWEYNYNRNTWTYLNPGVVGGILNVSYAGFDMVYDSSADRIIKFGEHYPPGTYKNFTWVYNYNDNTWYKMNPTFIGGSFTLRTMHRMAYNSQDDHTILFGGSSGSGQLSDTWIYKFNENTWYKIDYKVVGGTFTGKEESCLAYGSNIGKTILFSGFNNKDGGTYHNETWVFKYNSGNEPPNPPTKPEPVNGSSNVEIDADISWYCWDVDLDDLTYDVYFEADNPTPDVKVSSNQTKTAYDPGTMEYNSTYYWRIVAWDSEGHNTVGPIWHFTTENAPGPEPDLNCGGSLSWTGISPGSTVTGSFYVENIGEPFSLLDWEIESIPDWGSWSITPEEGYNITPEQEPFVVEVSVIVPDKKNSEFTGEVKIVNFENTSDYCTVDVFLSMPRNKSSNYNFNLLNWLFDRFSIIERLIDLIRNI